MKLQLYLICFNAWENNSADSLKVKFRLPQLEASCKIKTHSLETSYQLTPPTSIFLFEKG